MDIKIPVYNDIATSSYSGRSPCSVVAKVLDRDVLVREFKL